MHLNHPQIILTPLYPPPTGAWKICLPCSKSLMPKSVGTAGIDNTNEKASNKIISEIIKNDPSRRNLDIIPNADTVALKTEERKSHVWADSSGYRA